MPEPPARPSTTDTPGARPPPPKATAPPKPSRAADSLLGLDFFGGPPTSGARPSSVSSTPAGSTGPSRPDLKQSILSLYASAPKPQPQQQPEHERQPSFGGMQSPPVQQQSTSSFGGLDDAFSNLNFNPPVSPPQAPKPQQQPKSDPFASFNNPSSQRSSIAAPQVTSPPPLSGGGFFDAGPKLASKAPIASKPPQVSQTKPDPLSSNDFGDFSFASSPAPVSYKPSAPASNDLFDFSEPSPPAPQKAPEPTPASSVNSAFNLSAPAAPVQPPHKPSAPAQPPLTSTSSGFSNMDAWGSGDVWATPDPTPTTTAPKPKPAATPSVPSIPMSSDFSAWGGSAVPSSDSSGHGFGSSSQAPPKVTPDEDFGGWSSAPPVTPATHNPPPMQNKPAGGGGLGGGSDDLFSNVWE